MRKQKKPGNIRLGFDMETIELRRSQIMPLKAVTDIVRSSRKFRQIVSSIREVGVIEPPVVTPVKGKPGSYMLLDGHLRLDALKELGIDRVTCLISTDDEAFTYNKHVNRLSPIQEHLMIRRAVARGVSAEKIARALSVEASQIKRKRKLLDGICAEAADILKDKMVTGNIFPVLKRMKPFRQIEAVTLMRDANLYTLPYAKAQLAATPQDQLAEPARPKRIKGLDGAQMARMEQEMQTLHREHKLLKESYGEDFYALTVARGWLASLVCNPKIVQYLSKRHPEILAQFQKIVAMKALLLKDEAVEPPAGKAKRR